MPHRKKIFLIDGSGFIYRAFHALPPLTRKDGTPIGAVYGFVKAIRALQQRINSGYLAVVFDAGKKTFRNDLYPEYKAHRPPTPEELIPQFPIVREAVKALNIAAVESDGYEADDVIATYAKKAKEEGLEVVIVSSDKDLMQLIDDKVSMYDALKSRSIGEEEVVKKFGVAPDKVIDAQALIGDSSDNIPGVAGIGVKTAAQLINEYGSLDNLLEHAEEIPQKKRRETLLASKDIAKLSYELVKLCDDVPVAMPLEEMKNKPVDEKTLAEFFKEQGFHGLLAKMDLPKEKEKQYELISNISSLKEWVKEAREAGIVAFDTETTSLNAKLAELAGFSLCKKEGEACYVPLQHKEGQGDLLGNSQLAKNQIPLEEAIKIIKPLLEDEKVIKIGHNIKYDMLIMRKYGVEIKGIEDTMLMSYVLNAGLNNHNMDEIAYKYLGIKPISFKEVIGRHKSFADIDVKEARDYAAEDADITMRLYDYLKQNLFN